MCIDITRLLHQGLLTHYFQPLHLQTKAHKCLTCDRSFQSNKSLRQHIKTHEPEGNKVECSICAAMISPSNISRPKKSHSLQNFRCGMCGKSYSFKTNLKRHEKKCTTWSQWLVITRHLLHFAQLFICSTVDRACSVSEYMWTQFSSSV